MFLTGKSWFTQRFCESRKLYNRKLQALFLIWILIDSMSSYYSTRVYHNLWYWIIQFSAIKYIQCHFSKCCWIPILLPFLWFWFLGVMFVAISQKVFYQLERYAYHWKGEIQSFILISLTLLYDVWALRYDIKGLTLLQVYLMRPPLKFGK